MSDSLIWLSASGRYWAQSTYQNFVARDNEGRLSVALRHHLIAADSNLHFEQQ